MKLSKTKQRLMILSLLFATVCVPNVKGQGGYDSPQKTDTFNAGPGVYHVQRKHPEAEKSNVPARDRQKSRRGPTARLQRGEIVQVMQSSRSARPELAFYLPPEATSVVQVVVERRGSQVNYFLKGLSSGTTVGGAVERAWLDQQGFRPRNLADEARIQAAVRHNPLYIDVR